MEITNVNTEVVTDGAFSEEVKTAPEGEVIAIIGGADGPTSVFVSSVAAEPEGTETSAESAETGTEAAEETTVAEQTGEASSEGEQSEEVSTEETAETTSAEVKTTETTVVEDSPLGNLDPNPQNFVNNLGYMGIGMAGIFVVIAIIIGATALMNKIFSEKK